MTDEIQTTTVRPNRERLVLFMARKDGRRVGASFCVYKDDQLYGRYWGSDRDYDCLYFKLAFYAPIAHSIEQGWKTFWVGFGNSYTKFARGLLPSPTHSAHRIFDPALQRSIGAHLVLRLVTRRLLEQKLWQTTPCDEFDVEFDVASQLHRLGCRKRVTGKQRRGWLQLFDVVKNGERFG